MTNFEEILLRALVSQLNHQGETELGMVKMLNQNLLTETDVSERASQLYTCIEEHLDIPENDDGAMDELADITSISWPDGNIKMIDADRLVTFINKHEKNFPNRMYEKLRPHIGHRISCVCYGREGNNDPADICIECEDCNEVLVSAEDYE